MPPRPPLLLAALLAGCAAAPGTSPEAARPAELAWSGAVEVRETLRLPRGTRLVIAPGTTVRFAGTDADGDGWGDVSLLVEGGEVIARGTPAAPVVFTSATSPAMPGSWGEIRVDFGRVELSHALIEGSTRGLHLHFTGGRVEDSVFRDNVDGTRIGESRLEVVRCLFANQTGKGYNARASRNTVEGNWFRGNRNGVFLFEGDDASVFRANRFTGNATPFRLGDFYEGTVIAPGNEWDREPADYRAEGNDTARLLAPPGKVDEAGPVGWPLLKPAWRAPAEGFCDADPAADEGGVYAADWGGRLLRMGFLGGRALAETRLGDTVDAALALTRIGGRPRLAVAAWDRTLTLLDGDTLDLLDRFTESPSPADDHRQAAPVFDGTRLFAPTWAGRVRAFDISGGRLAPLWTFEAGGAFRAPPLVARPEGGTPLLLAPCENGVLYALDPESGKRIWSYDAGAPLVSGLAADGNTAYAGDRSGMLHALDLAKGLLRWKAAGGAPLWHAPPLLEDGVLYQGDDAGTLTVRKAADGSPLWTAKLPGPVRSRPAPAGGDLLAVSCLDGSLALVRASDGFLLDRLALDGPLHASPAAQGNRLFLGSRGGSFFAVDVVTRGAK